MVKSFKLLVITIDDGLLFQTHIKNLKLGVNKRLYSIKKLFFLSDSVKVQFFKTFIMPCFDYCITLSVYLTKTQIDSLEKFYNVCLFRLLNLNLFYLSVLGQFKILKDYNLLPFRMRLVMRLGKFCHKIMNEVILVPFQRKLDFKNQNSALRFVDLVEEPFMKTNFAQRSLEYFLPRFINKVLRNWYQLSVEDFDKAIKQNVEIFFNNFDINFFLIN